MDPKRYSKIQQIWAYKKVRLRQNDINGLKSQLNIQMEGLTERDRLILSYQGIEKIPIQDFAIMVGKSYDTVRRRFKDCIKKDPEGGYYVLRQLPELLKNRKVL